MKSLPVILLLLLASAVSADVLTATWNIRWFPSGRAEHRAPPEVEKATVQGAAELVRSELAKRRKPSDHVILFFQEMRDESACSNLVAAIGDKTLSLVSMSAFREFDRRLGWQQSGIVSDLPVVEASFSYWRRSHKVLPPRGFTYALLDGGRSDSRRIAEIYREADATIFDPRLSNHRCQITKMLVGRSDAKPRAIVMRRHLAGHFEKRFLVFAEHVVLKQIGS